MENSEIIIHFQDELAGYNPHYKSVLNPAFHVSFPWIL